jgi:cardiolipin synthase
MLSMHGITQVAPAKQHPGVQAIESAQQTQEPVQIGPNAVLVYADGMALAKDMLSAIQGARKTILFETFLWGEDPIGKQFKQALIERARAGVEVYIIYDRLGNLFYSSPRFKQFPKLPTLHVLPYRSVRRPRHLLDPRRIARDHRKLLIVDGQTGFAGGYNISERWLRWRDTHMRLQGPAVSEFITAFTSFWNHECGDRPRLKQPLQEWNPHIRVYCNDAIQMSFPIRAIYMNAIERAQERIWITQAYFVPDRMLLGALMRAAKRGVDVRIMMPAKSEHVTADRLSQRRFERCLRSGIRIFPYNGPILHAKTATVDGQWSMIGSANFDRLSLFGNHEINVEMFSRDLARQMEELFERDLESAEELERQEWAQRPWHRRAIETLLAPFWPLV